MKNKYALYWQVTYWLLFVGWVVGALLNMMHVHGGVLTNYLADATFPAWFYIYVRGLRKDPTEIPPLLLVGQWFGKSPHRAALSIFAVGVVTEYKTLFWPASPMAGTFDPWDIFCYGFGLSICCLFDWIGSKQPTTN
ncbi:MAG: hypothetical protein JSS79_20840 [Bacteroidetes bacterium]|nr:hypothetical protein [Bacteroidota bacterium]